MDKEYELLFGKKYRRAALSNRFTLPSCKHDLQKAPYKAFHTHRRAASGEKGKILLHSSRLTSNN